MRENKKLDDYVKRIRQEIKAKYNIDIPEQKIRKTLSFFFIRIKESMLTHRFIYINKYFYLYFSYRRFIKRLVKRKELLTPEELYEQKKSSAQKNQPYYERNKDSFTPPPFFR